MRRWVISSALLANALASGVVLLVLLYRGGWGNTVDLSPVVAQILVVLRPVSRSHTASRHMTARQPDRCSLR